MGINSALMSAYGGDVYSLLSFSNSTASELIKSIYVQHDYGSCLKNVFWPNFFVGASFLILKILEYSSGLKRGSASKLNQNPIFEIASGNIKPL
jgi:hypothetical protein